VLDVVFSFVFSTAWSAGILLATFKQRCKFTGNKQRRSLSTQEFGVMVPQGFYSVAERQREKRESRARDVQRIACEEVSRADVQERNGFFSSLDASRARLVNPRIRVQIAA
jgi:hypothetical protein